MSSRSALIGVLFGLLVSIAGVALLSVPVALIVTGVGVTGVSALFVDVGGES